LTLRQWWLRNLYRGHFRSSESSTDSVLLLYYWPNLRDFWGNIAGDETHWNFVALTYLDFLVVCTPFWLFSRLLCRHMVPKVFPLISSGSHWNSEHTSHTYMHAIACSSALCLRHRVSIFPQEVIWKITSSLDYC